MNHKSNIAKMQAERKCICEFCGAVKKTLSFVIGASSKPDWCMIYGTGKMACPACYETAQAEARLSGTDAIGQSYVGYSDTQYHKLRA